MKRKSICLLTLLLLVSASWFVRGQNRAVSSFTIKGQVIDSLSGEPVPYVTLRIAAATDPQKPVKLLACDENGRFKAAMNKAGRYVMTMESVGKMTGKRDFTLSAEKQVFDFGRLLMQDDTQKLDEVTVTAQKPLVKVDVDKLTYNLEDDPEATTSNALEMLRKVPMLTVDGEDNIQLKGSSNYKIYLNGKPSNLLSGENASDVLKSMPASSIKNIEVITDPGAKYDAEGVGGIINIVMTKNALQGYTGTVRADAGTLGTIGGGTYLSLKAGGFGVTANYSYNHNDSPWNDSYSERTTDADNLAGGNPTLLKETGRGKNKGPMQFGYLETSYEIDTLNLLSVGISLFKGTFTNYSGLDADLNIMGFGTDIPVYSYYRNSESKSSFGSADVNVDYQHSTTKKDELLTLSYRFSRSPNDNENLTELSDVVSYYLAGEYPKRNSNDAATTEHTVQVDYTTPLFGNHTLEAGIKYINRRNASNTLEQIYNDSTNVWEDHSDEVSDFRHVQHIYSAYLGYLARIGKFGLKTGVRAEGTSLNAEFRRAPEMNFKTHYFDVIPSATLTYQWDMSAQIRIGYNMRIQRPGIWYLNPYINDTNPQNVSQGNPNLDSEKSNSVNLNFSRFTQDFSMDASLSYTFVNNSIESYNRIADFPSTDDRSQYNGAVWNTYGNIGKRQQAGFFLYASYSPTAWFRIYLNGSLYYTKMESRSMEMSNDGVSGGIFSGTQFTLPLNFRINTNGGYFSPSPQLQGKGPSFYFAGLNVSKDFLKKRLSVSLGAQNPFWKRMKTENTTVGDGFGYKQVNWRSAREFRIGISYRFGDMKGSIKKVRRGIHNDDSKAGGNSGNGGGQEMM